jgi:hypothetical protein
VRQVSHTSRRRSIDLLFTISRSSRKVLFGSRYVSTIVRATNSALSIVLCDERLRILSNPDPSRDEIVEIVMKACWVGLQPDRN